MNALEEERAEILDHLDAACDVPRMLAELHLSHAELADWALSIKRQLVGQLGGPPRYTGNNRVYRNGAIGYEVRCRDGRRRFWTTFAPFAWRPDCDRAGPFR